jgi:hypothetical protein
MPMSFRSTLTAGEVWANPFLGPVNHTSTVRVDVSALTTDEVDADGYIKPGTIFKVDGTLITGAAELAYGLTVEAVKVAENNGADLATAPDVDVAVALICAVKRGLLESNLGRALSAHEVEAIGANPAIVLVG